MELSREGREYFYWPFWGSGLDEMQINVGGEWVDMEAVPLYVPVKPVAADAVWFRALIAGPEVTSNPDGTAVLDASVAVRFRLSSESEIVVRSDSILRLR